MLFNQLSKKTGIIYFIILLIVLHMPFAFANTTPDVIRHSESLPHAEIKPDAAAELAGTNIAMYEKLDLNVLGLSKQAFEYAMRGYDYLCSQGELLNDHIISIADFSKPSSEKRLFIIDLDEQKLLFNTYVAHGVNSGKEYATQFSNRPQSNQSSLGFYETRETYMGGNGYSLKLEGLEKGINDKALDRAIVIHGAPYVTENLVKSQGYIGRSWGCPALPVKLHKPIIDKIKNGTCLFIFSPDKKYLKNSQILNHYS